MFILYPDIKPYSERRLSVDSVHTIYVEESGNPQGLPVLVLHGGPGAGCDPILRRFFNPDVYRIILFDQRGCGRSQPHAELENNNTQALIGDMETIRRELDISSWVLFGGSWGSTLGLAYAQQYPELVKAMILRGIFLCRDEDFSWFFKTGAPRIFPDAWNAFVKNIPQNERDDILEAYHKRLTGKDELAKMAASKQWALWEAQCSTLKPSHTVLDHMTDPHVASSLAQIECHYFLNNAFLSPNQLIENASKLANIPGIIIHGRYDMVCPLDNAFELASVWEKAELQIVRDAGHASMEPGIVDALIRATDDIGKRITAWSNDCD